MATQNVSAPPSQAQQARDRAAGVVNDAAAANSIVALREQVVALAEVVQVLLDREPR